MLPTLLTLLDVGIEPPVYIRKIDSKSKWYPEGCENILERARRASELLFKDPKHLYSLWLVNTAEELYGVLASLTANRKPQNQSIDFIWIKENELQELNIKYEQEPEGKCLKVKLLHFNAQIDKDIAEKLCFLLMNNQREANRISKEKIKLILDFQRQVGCKATENTSVSCTCEK